MLARTYFAFSRKMNLLYVLDRWLNPYTFTKSVSLNGKQLEVVWSKRANRVLVAREKILYVEMQLFFSCVVKKRVLFHDDCRHDSVAVTDNMFVLFRPVEAASCDPVEFAKNFPEKRELDSTNAIKMRARKLSVDYVDGEWVGEYLI
ncbi:MAG: hypothetical protein OEM38_11055 [Gammaproteobacteria bacterium]|nr:hypothetical protein [Gammaproteobacteria bacterium]